MRALLLSACILVSTVTVSAADNVRDAETAWLESLWLLDSGRNPCLNLRARCSSQRFLTFRQIIMARERGDEQAAERWLNILWWNYYSDDSRR